MTALGALIAGSVVAVALAGFKALEKALEDSRTVAVFLGPGGLGPWQHEEMRAALDQRVKGALSGVIPVLLPGAREKDVPPFLVRMTWVDFGSGLDNEDAFHHLVCGIRGVAPEAGAAAAVVPYRSMAQPPEGFVERRELEKIIELLCAVPADADATVAITTALRGAGGFGKTTLAQALAFDERVRRTYPGGILWVTMGESVGETGRVARIRDLLRWWQGEEPPAFETPRVPSCARPWSESGCSWCSTTAGSTPTSRHFAVSHRARHCW